MSDPRVTIIDAIDLEIEPRVKLVIALLKRLACSSAPELDPEAAAGAAVVLREALDTLHETIIDALPDPHGPEVGAAAAKPWGALDLGGERHSEKAWMGLAAGRLVADVHRLSIGEVMQRWPDPADLAAEAKRLIRLARETSPRRSNGRPA